MNRRFLKLSLPTPSPWLGLLLLAVTAAPGLAQEAEPTGERVTARGDGSEPVTLTQSVKPSFRIEPVVHRFTGRRGEVIPFEFELGSLGSEMEVTVTPVNLRQEETGVILHDAVSDPARALRLSSPRKFTVAPGMTSTIRGEVTVPLARTNYLSYGLLVRESGIDPNFEAAGDGPVKAGIRFVTQYVLRIDIETGVADIGAMGEMRFEQGRLISDQGLPRIQTYLNNPTNFAFECFVNASLPTSNENSRERPIRLGMSSRESLRGAERYLVRIMPNSRLRLEAPIKKVMQPGAQTLRLSLTTGRREVNAADFAINVNDDDFPALAQKRAILSGGVSVMPAQLELGSIKSTTRSLGLRMQNSGSEPVEVSLRPVSLQGDPIENVRFSPQSFTLKGGRTKGVRATLRRKRGELTEAAVAVVTCTTADGATTSQRLPLSILHTEPSRTSLKVAQVNWKEQPTGGAFFVEVSNPTPAYTPVDALLAVGGKSGERFFMQDGYGRWLAPGETRSLRFVPEQPVPAGEYALQLEVRTRDGLPPITREMNVTLSGEATTASL